MEREILEEVRRIARAELDFGGLIEARSRLKEDLQLDSMAMIVVAVGLENRFQVKLDEQDAGTIATVGDLTRLVERRLAEQRVTP
jgi:acyl carrier protein